MTENPRNISEAPPHVQAVIRGYAAFNARDLEGIVPELDEERTCSTREQVKGRIELLLRAFPDLSVSHLRAFDLGRGRVGVSFVFSGTNLGPLGEHIPATGRSVRVKMLDLVRFDASGRVVSARNLTDLGEITRQLGLSDA